MAVLSLRLQQSVDPKILHVIVYVHITVIALCIPYTTTILLQIVAHDVSLFTKNYTSL